MKVLLFGGTGQVGRQLRRHPQVTHVDRQTADLTDHASCVRLIATTGAAGVINAAAYTAVDRAETEEALALQINATAPTAMARAAAERGLPFVHLSTDYVFDGAGEAAFAPDAPVAPLSAYGRTKAAGEVGVRAAGGPHVILRTSWVFSAHGGNFVKSILRLGAAQAQIRVVADQIGSPTPADAVARACLEIVARLAVTPALSGTYHYAGAPEITRAGFARQIIAQAGQAATVAEILTRDYPTPARRPLNARLDCSATQQAFGLARPDWRAGLADVLAELRVA